MEETLTHRSKCRTWKKGSYHPSTDRKWDILYYDEAEYGRRPDLRLLRWRIASTPDAPSVSAAPPSAPGFAPVSAPGVGPVSVFSCSTPSAPPVRLRPHRRRILRPRGQSVRVGREALQRGAQLRT